LFTKLLKQPNSVTIIFIKHIPEELLQHLINLKIRSLISQHSQILFCSFITLCIIKLIKTQHPTHKTLTRSFNIHQASIYILILGLNIIFNQIIIRLYMQVNFHIIVKPRPFRASIIPIVLVIIIIIIINSIQPAPIAIIILIITSKLHTKLISHLTNFLILILKLTLIIQASYYYRKDFKRSFYFGTAHSMRWVKTNH
jgi:hypothetical protein